MEINVKKNFSWNVVYGFFNKFAIISLQFILRTIVIKKMGEQYIGLNGLFSSILQFLSLAELGFGTALAQSMYEPLAKNDTDTISNILGMYKKFLSLIGMCILLMGIILLPFVPKLIKDAEYPPEINIYIIYLLYLINTAVSYGVLAYRGVLFSVYQRNSEISKISLIINILRHGLQILVIVLMKNYYLLVVLYSVATITENFFVTVKAKRVFPQYFVGNGEVACRDEIVKKTKALMGIKLYSVIIQSADTITISYFIGLTATAIYSNYYYIIQGIFGCLEIILSSLVAGIGNSLIIKTKEVNYEQFLNITFLYNWIITVCASCLLCVYQPFMIVWVGSNLLFDKSTMIILVVYFYLWKIKDTLALYKDAYGLWWEDRYRPWVCAFLDIILNILFVKSCGIMGVLIATIVSDFIVSFPWCVRVTFKCYFERSEREYYKQIFVYILEAAAVSAVTYAISNCILCTTYRDIVLLSVLCLIISNILMLLIHLRNARFRTIVSKFIVEVRRRYRA